MNAHVRVERAATVECFPACATFMGFLLGVDNLMTAQRTRLAEPFATNLADEGSGA